MNQPQAWKTGGPPPRAGSTRGAGGTLRLACVIVWPVIAVAAWLWALPWLKAVVLPLLVAVIVWPGLRARRTLPWTALAGVIAFSIAALYWPPLGMAPPVIICLLLALGFAWSLRPGARPLIEQFARRIHDARGETLPAGSGRWLRAWTLTWAVVMLLLAAGAGALALIAPLSHWWLAWVVIVLPLSIGGLLALEYRLRVRRFPDFPHAGFIPFLRAMTRIRWRELSP